MHPHYRSANERGFFPKIRRVRIPTTTPKPPPVTEDEGKAGGKELGGPDADGDLRIPGNSCPYFFYYNTR